MNLYSEFSFGCFFEVVCKSTKNKQLRKKIRIGPLFAHTWMQQGHKYKMAEEIPGWKQRSPCELGGGIHSQVVIDS